jgi:hypothetical protein
MLGIDKFIINDGSKFYIDVENWKCENDLSLDDGDMIKFNYENKKYIAKIINIGNSNSSILELSILKEL